MKNKEMKKIVLAIAECGINGTNRIWNSEGDSLEVSDYTPMYNPHRLPLITNLVISMD